MMDKHGRCGLLAIVILLLFPSVNAGAGVIHFKSNATGANTGASWTDAYTDLQNALATAKAADEIWVAAGTYKPTSGIDRNKSFVLVSGVALYGGFAGTETVREQRNWEVYETILSGDIGTAVTKTDNSYHVVAGGFNSVLDGFTVTGGNAEGGSGGGMFNDSVSPTIAHCTFSGNSAGYGGGMYNFRNSPTVTNCTFSGNTANYGGGGMYNSGGLPNVTHCTFSGNMVTNGYGGGIYNNYGSPEVTYCIFSGNKVTASGGGMYNSGSPTVTNCTFSGNSASWGGGMFNYGGEPYSDYVSPEVTYCMFSGNTANYEGGGMYNSRSSPTVTNCTFSGNSTSYGGGMYNSRHGLPTVTYCIFSGNKVTDSGGGMYNDYTSPEVTQCTFNGNSAGSGGGMCNFGYSFPMVTNTILWINHAPIGAEVNNTNSQPTFRHCSIRGSGRSGAQWDSGVGTDGGGNITADLRFVDSNKPAGPDGIWMTADDGLRLQANSTCVDAGDPNVTIETDILDNPRRGLPDIGAYEYQPLPLPNSVAVWAIYD